MERLGDILLKVVPRLKGIIQLSGLVVGLVIMFLGSISSPPNLPVLICGGLIAVAIIVFTISLNVLDKFPKNQRAGFITKMFLGFMISTIILLGIAVYFLLNSTQIRLASEVEIYLPQLQHRHRELRSEIDAASDRVVRLEAEIARASAGQQGGVDLRERKEGELASAREELRELRRRADAVESLIKDANAPEPRLVRVVEAARAELGFIATQISPLGRTARADTIDRDLVNLAQNFERIADAEQSAAASNWVNAAWLRQIFGDYSRALILYHRARDLDPNNLGAIEGLAEVHFLRDEHDRAEELYILLLQELERQRPDAHWQRAVAEKEIGTLRAIQDRNDAAREYYIRALQTYDLSGGTMPVILASINQEYGLFLFWAGRFDAAEERFARAIAYYRQPSSSLYHAPDAFSNASQFNLDIGKYSSALAFARSALDAQQRTGALGTKTNAVILWTLSAALAENGRIEDARDELQRATALLDRLGMSSTRRHRLCVERATIQALLTRSRMDLEAAVDCLTNLQQGTGQTERRIVHYSLLVMRVARALNEFDTARNCLTLLHQRIGTLRFRHLAERVEIETALQHLSDSGSGVSGSDLISLRNKVIDNPIINSPFDRYRQLLFLIAFSHRQNGAIPRNWSCELSELMNQGLSASDLIKMELEAMLLKLGLAISSLQC